MTLDTCIESAIQSSLKRTPEKGDPALERLRRKLPRRERA